MRNVAIYRNSDSSSLYKRFAIQSGGDNFDVDKKSQRATFKRWARAKYLNDEELFMTSRFSTSLFGAICLSELR